jgi:hypothetical protein
MYKRITNLDAFKAIFKKTEGADSAPLCVRVLIKAVSVNIEYRDICCQNIEYRIEIDTVYRPITI